MTLIKIHLQKFTIDNFQKVEDKACRLLKYLNYYFNYLDELKKKILIKWIVS